MSRRHSHFENKEPFFEKFLCELRFRMVVKHIPANSKMLDVGCGYNGKLLYKIKEKISAGFGIDISVNKISRDEKIVLIEHDLACPLPFEDNSFDAVNSLANLEHLHNPEKNLIDIHRVLRPGGMLLLTTPSVYAKPVLETLAFFGIVSREEIRDHKNYFNKKILSEYCREIGFSSFRHRYFQFGMNNFLMAKK